MKDRTLKIIFNKSGSGSITPKMNVPIRWLKDMGVNEQEREVVAEYDEERQQIIIKKKK